MNAAVLNVQCWFETLGCRVSALFVRLRRKTAKPTPPHEERVRIAGLR